MEEDQGGGISVPDAIVVVEGGSNMEEEEVEVPDRDSVPGLPPIPQQQSQGWICCGVGYTQQRNRCGLCRKLKAGKRTNFMRRK